MIRAGTIVLRVPDRGRRLAAVRLLSDLHKRGERPAFRRVGTGWQLRLPQPAADRLEYLLELEHGNGRREIVAAPGTLTVDGPLGPKSVLALSSYREPRWLDADAPPGLLEPLALPSAMLHATVEGLLWAPAGTSSDEALPLLVVHDGPEYAEYSGLVRFLEVASAAGRIPTLRAALLAPVERVEHYSASARYAASLVREVLPALTERAPTPRGRIVGMGTSLGALAALHAHRRYPDAFSALFLQSGSFFRRGADDYEAGFPRFDRIVRFVRTVLRPLTDARRIRVTLTCGSAEENLSSNFAVAAALVLQGYDVMFGEVRDAHNWVAWRDAFEPHLSELLRRELG